MRVNYNIELLILNIICIILCLFSCSPYPKEVENALSASGNNRSELVKVLDHYIDRDLLKFEAACFLISNMPYHKSKYELELPGQYFE